MFRVSEHYVSIQGEGSRTGVLTQFVRLAGCNMRCPGWPCDTQHAIDPKIWGKEARKASQEYLLEEILYLAKLWGVRNICITGGEPLLWANKGLNELADELTMKHELSIDLFTNGSIELPQWTKSVSCHVMMDWKLAGSGEAETYRDVRLENIARLRPKDGIKFVCKDENDLQEAWQVYHRDIRPTTQASVWVGSAWDTLDVDDIIHFVEQNRLPWRVNVQVHKYLWPNASKGI